MIMSKVTILLLYHRLFHIRKSMRYAVYAGLVYAGLTSLTYVILGPYFYVPRIGEGWGPNLYMRYMAKDGMDWLIATSAMSLLLDIYIFVLPIPYILSLQLSRQNRWGVIMIFSTAFLCVPFPPSRYPFPRARANQRLSVPSSAPLYPSPTASRCCSPQTKHGISPK